MVVHCRTHELYWKVPVRADLFLYRKAIRIYAKLTHSRMNQLSQLVQPLE